MQQYEVVIILKDIAASSL